MNSLSITKSELKQLHPLELNNEIMNTESQLFVMDEKTILKRIYRDSGPYFSNKVNTVKSLIEKRDTIDMEELIIPESLVRMGKYFIGWTMPYIENVNLTTILASSKWTIEQKVEYLKDIGRILNAMKQLRDKGSVENFYINDLHDSNLILNLKTNRINVVDLDSAKIGDNMAAPSRYLTPYSKIDEIDKYPKESNPLGGAFKITEDTELYCYILIIIKAFYGESVSSLPIKTFYVYLEYLNSIGIPQDILDIFSYIYSDHPNVNPAEYLEELIPYYSKMTKQAYKRALSKK